MPETPADAVLIQLVGEVDVHDRQTIRTTATAAAATGRPVRVDCQNLVFMDCSVLVLFAALVRSRQPVTVVALRPRLKKLLELTALDRFLTFSAH